MTWNTNNRSCLHLRGYMKLKIWIKFVCFPIHSRHRMEVFSWEMIQNFVSYTIVTRVKCCAWTFIYIYIYELFDWGKFQSLIKVSLLCVWHLVCEYICIGQENSDSLSVGINKSRTRKHNVLSNCQLLTGWSKNVLKSVQL